MVQGTWKKETQVAEKKNSNLKAIDFKKLREVFGMRFSKDNKSFIVGAEGPDGKKGVIIVSKSSKGDQLFAGTDIKALQYSK